MSESIDHRDGICAAGGGGGKDMTGSCAISEGGDIMIEIWGGGGYWHISVVGGINGER